MYVQKSCGLGEQIPQMHISDICVEMLVIFAVKHRRYVNNPMLRAYDELPNSTSWCQAPLAAQATFRPDWD